MADVVILSGPPGVGKTTVSRILADLLPGTVCIHGDDLRGFAPIDARKHLGGGSTFRAAAALANAYLGMGAARVVFDYVFLRPSHLAYFREGLGSSATPLHMFTLWASLELVQSRERGRLARSPLGVAVDECWNEIDSNKSVLGTFVDNTMVEPSDTARKIAALVEHGVARLEGWPMAAASRVSTVIVLNGASSSGKTTLVKMVRDRIGIGAAAVSIDDLYGSVHEERRNDFALFRSLTQVLFDSAAGFAREGFDVVVDTVFERRECHEICVRSLQPFRTLMVGLQCPLDVLAERERTRANRRAGLAADQAGRVHEGVRYDLVLDTASSSPDECAAAIARDIRRWSSVGTGGAPA